MATTPEGKVKAAIKKLLKAHGIWYYCPMQNGMGVVGIPDFICCVNGLFLAIEAKAPGKKGTVTPNQVQRMAEIRQANGLVFVIDNALELEAHLVMNTWGDIRHGREEESIDKIEESCVKEGLQKRVRSRPEETY